VLGVSCAYPSAVSHLTKFHDSYVGGYYPVGLGYPQSIRRITDDFSAQVFYNKVATDTIAPTRWDARFSANLAPADLLRVEPGGKRKNDGLEIPVCLAADGFDRHFERHIEEFPLPALDVPTGGASAFVPNWDCPFWPLRLAPDLLLAACFPSARNPYWVFMAHSNHHV
jgi:hypothetical protein